MGSQLVQQIGLATLALSLEEKETATAFQSDLIATRNNLQAASRDHRVTGTEIFHKLSTNMNKS